MGWFADNIGDRFTNASWKAEQAAWKAEGQVIKDGSIAAKTIDAAGKFNGDKIGTTLAAGGKASNIMKWGGAAAIAAAGLAAVGMMSRKSVNEATLQDEALSPSELAEINPAAQGTPISEDPALAVGGQTLMGQSPAPGEWAARVGGDEAPALASVKTPSIAEDMHADKVISQDSNEYSLGA